MPVLDPTAKTTLHRRAQRGSYDLDLINSILDEGVVCHVGVVADGQPIVLPMAYGRVGELLYLHGAAANHMLATALGSPVCATVTLLDGLVLARSAFRHSMNYRSVVLFGTAREVTDPDEKRSALDAIVDQVVPGRAAVARPANEAELRATRVVALPIDEASAKLRTGPPSDDPSDLSHPAWTGVIPLRRAMGEPLPAPDLPSDTPLANEVRRRAVDRTQPVREERRGELLLTTDAARLDLDALHEFLGRRSYWARGIPRIRLERAVRNSLCVIVVRPEEGDQLLGFARVVSDFATFAYLMDVFVVETGRARGVGKWMLEFIRQLPELRGCRRWLLGTRDAHGFYEQFGFCALAQPAHFMEILAPHPFEAEG
jgi:nitroimidazol reductase NimA-like FMN-containing flavoprotein (pyridoxamine 5'-phosphate oxidase superfamily)/GNAT superfamily N-acetyltransferase